MRHVRDPATLFVALALALSACGDDDAGEASWTVTRDTLPGGAALVLNTPPQAGLGPAWVVEEELRIGAVDAGGPAQFGQLKGLAVLADGRIAVLDAQAREVRVFDPDGAHRATHGRQGAGPGELEEPWGLMRDGRDRLWVPDHRNDRMTVYHPDRGLEASYALPVLRWGFVWDGAMLEDGRIVKPSITLAPERRPLLRIYGPEMALVDSIPLPEPEGPADRTNPPGAFYWEAPGGMPRGYMGVPFYPREQRVQDPSGDVWTTAPGDPSYRITRATLAGDTTLVIETRRPPVPVPGTVRDSLIDGIREMLRERGGSTDQDWSKVPRVKPAVESMFVADDGRLWVRTAAPDSLLHFDIYERDGRYAGTAVTGLALYPWVTPVVRDGRLWAVVSDALDVQYVVRARIRPTALPDDG